MRRVALVRHGETDWNRARLIQGRSDVPLNDDGRTQAEDAALLLGGGWGSVVTSPLRRARETGEIIAKALSVPTDTPVAELVERDYGSAEGIPVDDALARWPHGDYPGGESVALLADRGAECIDRISREAAGDVVIVSHGALLRASLEALTGRRTGRVLNGEVIVLLRDEVGCFRTPSLGAVERPSQVR